MWLEGLQTEIMATPQGSHWGTRQGEPRGCLHSRDLIQYHGLYFEGGKKQKNNVLQFLSSLRFWQVLYSTNN